MNSLMQFAHPIAKAVRTINDFETRGAADGATSRRVTLQTAKTTSKTTTPTQTSTKDVMTKVPVMIALSSATTRMVSVALPMRGTSVIAAARSTQRMPSPPMPSTNTLNGPNSAYNAVPNRFDANDTANCNAANIAMIDNSRLSKY